MRDHCPDSFREGNPRYLYMHSAWLFGTLSLKIAAHGNRIRANNGRSKLVVATKVFHRFDRRVVTPLHSATFVKIFEDQTRTTNGFPSHSYTVHATRFALLRN